MAKRRDENEIDMEFTVAPEIVPSVTEQAAVLVKQAAALLRTEMGVHGDGCRFIAGELDRWRGWLVEKGLAEGDDEE